MVKLADNCETLCSGRIGALNPSPYYSPASTAYVDKNMSIYLARCHKRLLGAIQIIRPILVGGGGRQSVM